MDFAKAILFPRNSHSTQEYDLVDGPPSSPSAFALAFLSTRDAALAEYHRCFSLLHVKPVLPPFGIPSDADCYAFSGAAHQVPVMKSA